MTQSEAREAAITVIQKAKRLKDKTSRIASEIEEMERLETIVESENIRAKREELRITADNYIHERDFILHDIERFIEDGNEQERRRGNILYQKDVNCLSFEQIAVDMHYTFGYVRQEYYAGLIAFGRWLNAEP